MPAVMKLTIGTVGDNSGEVVQEHTCFAYDHDAMIKKLAELQAKWPLVNEKKLLRMAMVELRRSVGVPE